VIWVHQHAEELGIDPNKIALSGFSSGANMACTIPLRLWDEMMGFPREDESPRLSTSNESPEPSAAKFSQEARVETIDPSKPPPPLNRSPLTKHNIKVREDTLRQVSDISLRAIVPWYPSLDYTRTREQRRATCSRKDQELPALFTDLFDESYVLFLPFQYLLY
jgi:carboxylesterase type B